MTIISPLAVYLPRKRKPPKKLILNLNNYRNWQFYESNAAKVAYTEAMEGQLKGKSFRPPILLRLTYWKGTARVSDRSNVLCIHEKFICDALVAYGCIQDDNDNFIRGTVYQTGGIDRKNPRVEIMIEENPR